MSIGGSGPISISGIISGLNTPAIIQAMLKVDQLPLNALDTQIGQITAQQTTWSNLNSTFQSLGTAAQAIQSSLFTQTSATSSNTAALSVSDSGTATAGSYSVAVTQLAAAELDQSAGQASATAGLGYQGSFTIGTGTQSATIQVATTDSLQSIAANINNAGVGVTASVIDTGSGSTPYVLWIQANQTDTPIQYADTSGTPLQQLGILTSTGTTNTVTQPAPSLFTVNGTSFQNASNTVSGAIPGLTLTLNSTGSSTVSVTQSFNALNSAVNAFVSAYNSAVDAINQDTGTSGQLQGSGILDVTQSQMAGIVNQTVPGVTPNNLGSIGITFVPATVGGTNNGHLQVDTATLDAAAQSNPAAVEALLSGPNGAMTQMSNLVNGLTGPGGTIASIQDSMTSQLTALDNEQSSLQQQINQEQQDLQNEFNNLEVTMANLKTQDASLASLTGISFFSSPGGSGSGSSSGGLGNLS